jgi:hypothetical protein
MLSLMASEETLILCIKIAVLMSHVEIIDDEVKFRIRKGSPALLFWCLHNRLAGASVTPTPNLRLT